MGILDVLSSIFNPVATWFNNQTQIQLQKDAQAWNKEQADIAWQRGLEQWNRENEYNSPEEQMRRLREAGINPALAFSNGVSQQAATSPDAPVPAPARAAATQAFQLDPLTFAQVANLEAQTRNLDAHTTYQNYVNQVEDALAKSPIGSVTVIDNEGNENVEIKYGNLRVEFAKRELQAIGLENGLNNANLNALLFDLALLTGSDAYGMSPFGTIAPSETPGYSKAKSALQGDQDVRIVASQMAKLSKEAADADKAGRKAYAAWLKKHEDEPIVKFMLALQGFVQSLGIHIPSFGGGSNQLTRLRNGFTTSSGRRWFFGGT